MSIHVQSGSSSAAPTHQSVADCRIATTVHLQTTLLTDRHIYIEVLVPSTSYNIYSTHECPYTGRPSSDRWLPRDRLQPPALAMEIIGDYNFVNASQPTLHFDLNMSRNQQRQTSYVDRLATFDGYWTADDATARQLAAYGHVYDRPPLEALEQGSRCNSCSAFVQREHSVRAFQGPVSQASRTFDAIRLHHPKCVHLALRNPLDGKNTNSDMGGNSRFDALRKRFERRFDEDADPSMSPMSPARHDQKSPFFLLPTELRLKIYSQLMPKLDRVTAIVPLNGDSERVVTEAGHSKRRPRDTTQINIMLTCRDVYEEALDTLFTNTTYKFGSPKVMYLFLRHIGEHGRRLLKAVDVICGTREDAIAFALLGACPKLRTITIRLPRPMLLTPRPTLWQVDGIACLLNLSGLQDVHLAECNPTTRHLGDNPHDAMVVKRELTRPKNERSSIRWVSGGMDVS